MRSKNVFGKWFLGVFAALMMLAAGSSVFAQQDVKAGLFKGANDKMQSARKAKAHVLAPKNFGEGMELYREADMNYQKGKNLDDIRKKLSASGIYFDKAMEATKLAEVTFVAAIKSRNDANNAEAIKYANALWTKAEEKFAEAASKLEDGNVNSAKKKAAEAEGLFREAELSAIKSNYLQETWDLLSSADRLDVKDRAPVTLKKAQNLIKDAEKELSDNRYDTDRARNMAQQAKYEAKHALYLNRTIENMKKQKVSVEDLILSWEMPLRQVAASMDMIAEFDEGYEKSANEMVEYVRTYRDSVANLDQQLHDRDQQIANLEGRIGELEGQLGSVAQEQSELKKRMEAQAKIRAQFQEVEKMFSREEARVFREGNDIILRLVGLNFASGKSVIEPRYFSMLTKVQNAIGTFPGSAIAVEGHTDSYGSDATNLRLSEERSEAVRQYLLANLRSLTPADVSSVGYGESKPIANNETAAGREKNRRIDIVIRPKLLGMN